MTTSVTVSFGSVTFTGEQIRSARVVEEIDPLAIGLPFGTLELTLFSADGDFSIINPSGFYASLQYNQPLEVTETINGTPYYIGKFYLDDWESISETEATFHAVDAIALLDAQTCLGYEIPNGIERSDILIDTLMTEAGVDYSLDSSLENIWLAGWIPICTYREALQQICFALGAYATCARLDFINIVPMELAGAAAYDYIILKSQKGLGQPVTLLPLVTGVELDSHYYTTDEINVQVFDGTLTAGNHRILFDNAKWVDSPTITGATNITAALRVNYIDINVPTTGTVTLAVADYADAPKVFSVYNNSLPVGTIPNVIKISDATLVSHRAGVSIDSQSVAQRVYDYYQQRYLQKVRLFAHPAKVGDSVLIEERSGWIEGIVKRIEIDLAGGFISQTEIVSIVGSTCANTLTANLTVLTGTDATYADCLNMLNFNVDLQGSANLIIN